MFTLRTLSILLSLLMTATAAGQTRVTVDPDSRLWIEGRSTVNHFTCNAGEIDGRAMLQRGSSEAEVVIPVESFDCGKSRMNRDFYEALKSERHPRILFELTDARLGPKNGDTFDVTVHGRLTIAGVTRSVKLVSEGRKQHDGEYRVQGSLPLSMLDFEIKPPTALAGLIKVHERIVVGFDIVTKIDGAATVGVCAQAGSFFC